MRYITYLAEERDFSMEVHEAQYNRVVSVQERLTMLEDKVVPGFGRTLHSVQDVVGDFDEWHQINPLDRRKDSAPDDPRAENPLDRREKPSNQS